MAADVRRLQDELAERDLVVDWAINSSSIAWDREAKARARVAKLSAALDSLQVYCNTLHEEVHVLYCRCFGPAGTLNRLVNLTLRVPA